MAAHDQFAEGSETQRAPRVSIGMPVYNAERFLAGTLDSIVAQSFRDFELIISDNGSTDRTASICRDYASRDCRIRYFRHEVNRGAAWNHNYVLGLAQGEFFKWNAYDDSDRSRLPGEMCVRPGSNFRGGSLLFEVRRGGFERQAFQ